MRIVRGLWRIGGSLVVFAVLAFAGPAFPSAAVGSTTAEFSLSGSNGYSLSFGIASKRAAVNAIRADSLESISSATYETKGRIVADRFRARFGSLGRVSVVFHPSGRVKRRKPPRRCEGEPRVTQLGVFVGTIRFKGEDGYTAVSASRARGRLRNLPRWRCKRRGRASFPLGPNPAAERKIQLEAISGDTHRRDFFSVSATRPPEEHGTTSFIASRIERRGSLIISRFAFTYGRERTFVFDEALATATVEPPPPFSGSASFLRSAGGTSSWAGSLSVDFPGAENVSMANESFNARLFRLGRNGIAEPGG